MVLPLSIKVFKFEFEFIRRASELGGEKEKKKKRGENKGTRFSVMHSGCCACDFSTSASI